MVLAAVFTPCKQTLNVRGVNVQGKRNLKTTKMEKGALIQGVPEKHVLIQRLLLQQLEEACHKSHLSVLPKAQNAKQKPLFRSNSLWHLQTSHILFMVRKIRI